MALESSTFINGLVATNPTSSDNISDGDNHIRLLKSTVKATFPNVSGAVSASHTDINSAVTAANAATNANTASTIVKRDSSGNFTAGMITANLTGDVTGNAASATSATTAALATAVTVTANNSTNESAYITFVDGASSSQGIESDNGLRYNPSTGTLATAALDISGNVDVDGTMEALSLIHI